MSVVANSHMGPLISGGVSGTQEIMQGDEGDAVGLGGLGHDMVERVKRIVSLHSPYEGRDRLLRVLPGRVSREYPDRVLDHLASSKVISLDGETIRRRSGQGRQGSGARGKDGGVACAQVLAGTKFETIEEGKLQTETAGEYIARILNDDEAGSCTAEDAAEIDEDMCRLARGECHSHERVWKEFGL